MSNIVSLNGAKDSEARSEFLRHIAQCFDDYVDANGHEPDALFNVFCGNHQPSRSGWLVRGSSEGSSTSLLAFAAISLTASAIKYDDIQ